jgi:bacterioferritin
MLEIIIQMGRTAKEIVKANVQEVISDLNKAYADEWLAHYQYWLTAQWIRGMDADTLKQVLIQQSADELTHAETLANRIIQLGGTPVMQFDQLTATAKCGFKEPPSDPANLKQVVQDVLAAEACAIESYNELSEKYRTTDIVTKEIFETLLEDEVGDEEKWENIGSKM